MRRENGAGTIIKIKDRKLRKPYKALVTVGYNLNGNPQRKVIGYFATYKEARLSLDKYLENKDKFSLSKLTFKEVYDRWFEEHSPKVSAGTVKGYNTSYKHLKVFNNKKFAEIKLLHYQDLFNKMTIKANSKRAIRSCLKEVYKYALRYEIVDKCQASGIEVGKHEKVIERIPFTKKEIEKLFEMKDNKYAKATLVMIYSGVRISELLKLTKEFITDEYIEIYDTKTPTGNRTIPIAHKIKDIVKEMYNKSDKYFIFKERNGKQLKLIYKDFRKGFDEVVDILGTQHTPHDTRHTFISMLGVAGANDVSLAKLAGHSDVSISKKVYSHRNIDELRVAINLLN